MDGWHLPAGLLGLSLGLVLLSASLVDVAGLGGLGLFGVLPWTYWLAVAALWTGFALLLRDDSFPSWLAPAYVAGLVVVLHAIPALVHAHPRFPTAWMHVGFSDAILERGEVVPNFDARFDWPGALSYGAFLTELVGASSARSLLRWAPVVMNGLLVVPLWLIAASVTSSPRARWLIVWFSLALAWVGQDYYAPQAMGILVYLTLVGVALRMLPARGGRFDLVGALGARWPQVVRRDTGPRPAGTAFGADGRQQTALTWVIVAVASVQAFSHQLTPFMLAGGFVVLLVTGRFDRLWAVASLVAVAFGWLFFGADTFFQANTADAVGDFGALGTTLQGSVNDRITPATGPLGVPRQLVLASRVALAALLGLAAVAASVRAWRHRRTDWTLLGLGAFPLSTLLLSAYGGEVMLRALLFASPFLAALVVTEVTRSELGPWPMTAVAGLVAVGAVMTPMFMLARFGNEAYEQIRTEDLALWDEVVERAPDGSVIIVPNFAGPWRYRELLNHEYVVYADHFDGLPTADRVLRLMEGSDRAYVILGIAGHDYEVIAHGAPDRWSQDLAGDLLSAGLEVVAQRGEAQVLGR